MLVVPLCMDLIITTHMYIPLSSVRRGKYWLDWYLHIFLKCMYGYEFFSIMCIAFAHLYACHISSVYLPHHNFFINRAELHAHRLQIRLFGASEHIRVQLAGQFNHYTQEFINICIQFTH